MSGLNLLFESCFSFVRSRFATRLVSWRLYTLIWLLWLLWINFLGLILGWLERGFALFVLLSAFGSSAIVWPISGRILPWGSLLGSSSSSTSFRGSSGKRLEMVVSHLPFDVFELELSYSALLLELTKLHLHLLHLFSLGVDCSLFFLELFSQLFLIFLILLLLTI